MAAITDVSVGYGKETNYGTPVTCTRWLEFTSETLDWTPNKVQGQGLRVSSAVPRSNKRVITTYDGGGTTVHECISKGMGMLFENAFGAGVSTLVSGSTYQQNFTIGGAPSPLTIQKGVVAADGTVQPYTFTSAMARSVEFGLGVGEILMSTFEWDAQNMATGTAYTSPSYASGGSLFHFAQGAVTLGGSPTAPTTTALASGGTSVANVRDFTFKLDNTMGDPRHNIGGAGLKSGAAARGVRQGTGTMTIELTDAVARDAILADTALGLVLTFTGTEALSTGYASLSLYLSAIKLDGPMPQATGGLPTMSVNFTMLDDLTNAPVTLSIRTADTAL